MTTSPAREQRGRTLFCMTSDPKVAAVIRQGCPECGNWNVEPMVSHDADCINREDHVHMICGNADCLNEWSARLV